MDRERHLLTGNSGQYLLPIDSKEQERLDIMHTMVLAARPRPYRLHFAPFATEPNPDTGERPRVLDLGFGTGIWLLDMAEKYPNVDFHGVDLHNMAPDGLLYNILLRSPVDYESPWSVGESSIDLIHLQMALGSVSNWLALYEKIYRHLKPGGYIEHVEIDWTPRCDDDTLPSSWYTKWWHTYVGPPYNVAGRPITFNPQTQQLLESRGFINVRHEQYRIPTNGWSNIKSEHVSGTWWENAMASGDGRGHGFEALSLAVLTHYQGWSAEHARKLCEDAMADAGNPNIHAYNWLHIYWAQKPPDAPR